MTTSILYFPLGVVLSPLLADMGLKSLILLILAALLVLALRNSSAAVRHLIWTLALFGAVELPMFSWWLPSLPVSGNWWPAFSTPVSAAPAVILSPRESVPTTTPTKVADAPASIAQPASANSARPAIASLGPTSGQKFKLTDFLVRDAGLIWLAGVGIALLPLLAGSWQVWRLTRRCVKLDEPEWKSLVEELSACLNLRQPVRLLCHPDVTLPMTWGFSQPVILLPEAARTWTELRRRVVLQHELAHVQRSDWLTCILAYMACAVYWFNPLAWYAARRMRCEREQACDDLVLAHDTRPSDYANELLQLAAGFSGRELIDWATVPMARRSALEGRLLAILDERRNRSALTSIAQLGAVVLAAAIIIPVAMLHAAATATDSSANSASQSGGDGTATHAVADASNSAKPVATMVNSRGIAIDNDGTLYAVDYVQHCVYKLSPQGQLSLLADKTNFPGMEWPSGVAVDQNKNVYLADPATNTIYKITPEGKVVALVGNQLPNPLIIGEKINGRVDFPTGVAVDAAGNLYVADNYGFTVSKVTPDGRATILAGTRGKSGATDGPAAQALFAKPRGVAVGRDGTVYVVDEGNNNIRKISPDGTVSTVAGSPDHVAGAQDGAGGQAFFSAPHAAIVDAQGNVYVADTNNFTIRKITPPNIVTTFAGKAGEAGYIDGPLEKARFNAPRSVAVDNDGNVYVTDSDNPGLQSERAVIRKITPAGVVSTVYSPIQIANSATDPNAPMLPNGTPSRLGQVQAFNVVGDVQLIGQDGEATLLRRGETFMEGNTIKVGPGSQAFIVFSNGSSMKILEDCTVKVTVPTLPNGTPNRFGQMQAFIVAGDVQLIDQDGKAAPLHRGETFEEGNTIKAAPGSQALIVFSNGVTLKVLENCMVKVALFRQSPFDEQAQGTFLRLSRDPSRSNTVLDLLSGTLQGEVKNLNQYADSTFSINTPEGPVKEYGVFNLNIDAMDSPAQSAATPVTGKQ